MNTGCNNKVNNSKQYNNNSKTKILYIVRHAKSSWADASLSDFERPLKKSGVNDAHIIGKILGSKNIKPDIILSSPANRAISTANILAQEMFHSDKEKKIITDKTIYYASISDIIDIIEHLDDSLQSVMLVGHNPTSTILVNYLTYKYFDKMPTCGVIAISFDISEWNMIKKNTGKLIFFEYPKKYKI